MVKYIGSKRALLPWITGVVEEIRQQEPLDSAVELFSGTATLAVLSKAWVCTSPPTTYTPTHWCWPKPWYKPIGTDIPRAK